MNSDVADITNKVAGLYGEAARQKNVHLQARIAEGTTMLFDRDQLAFIIRNLVANAIKFSNSGGSVIVEAGRTHNTTWLMVTDSGVGMSEEYIAGLFKDQLPHIHQGTFGETGSGLGLLTIREFADRNNAIIRVDSAVGKGSSFRLEVKEG